MSDPYTAVAGLALSYYQQRKAAQQPALTPPAVAPPPQAAKRPNVQQIAAGQAGAGQAGGKAGYAQTFLTGAGGVNPDTLTLGKTTLLGG